MLAFLPVSTAAGAVRSWPSRLASLALHAALIATAVRLSEAGETPVSSGPEEITVVLPDNAKGGKAPPPPPGGVAGHAIPVVTVPNVVLEFIPPPGVPIAAGLPVGDPLASWGDSVPLPLSGQTITGTMPIDVRVADEAPRLIDHPAVRYPEIMRQAGIEARVLIEVVLDTLGRAEASSLRVVHSGGVAFDAEARAVVTGSRYSAARLSGRAVRVRIQVPVSFALRP